MTREELAIQFAKDVAFKRLTPDRQKAVFESAVQRAGTTSQIETGQDVLPTSLDQPRRLSAQELFPSTTQAIQRPTSLESLTFPGGLPARVGVGVVQDIPRLVNQFIASGAERLRGVQRPFSAEVRGGNVQLQNGQPSRLDAFVRNIPGEVAQAAGLGTLGVLASETGLALRRATRGTPAIETVEEVLRVPQARLPKLTKQERTAYFQARSQQVRQQTMLQRQALKEEQLVLSQELGKAAKERSLYVREKLPALYSKQSSHYRSLVDQELAPVANDLILDEELRAFLRMRFANDPERLNAVSGRLGLINESPIQAANLPPPSYKIGELYQKALNLGQQLPRSVRESLRVYTPVEDATDDAISVLVDVLDSKGVKLKEARAFWKSWAPIRNQATREFRPFIEPDIATRTGSQRLIRLTQGMDPDNEVYAKTLSDLLEIDSLPGELKSVVAKLDVNQKAQLALTFQQHEANGALQAMKFRVSQIADKQARKWEKIKWVVGLVTGGSIVAGGINLFRRN